MDICNLLTGVNSLNDYIEITQNIKCRLQDDRILCNKSTVLCLKKICNLEIEYFNKFDSSGAAFEVVDRMLNSSQSSTKDLLQLTSLIRYWLDAARKHLITDHIHWWKFTAYLLGFIKKIHEKNSSLTDNLLDEIAECMLDLATSGKPDINQRYEILHTLNIICAESSREVRLALKTGFEHYFIRLATIMASCGHFGCQFTILETLLRWLQPRHDPVVRADAANVWFPEHLYSAAAKHVFLMSHWVNFYQDARNFLNNHNDSAGLVTSVTFRRLSVGKRTIVSASEGLPSWLDINRGTNSVGVLLQPAQLGALGATRVACETLSLTADVVTRVQLHRESLEVKISIVTSEPPIIIPTKLCPFDASDCDVTIVISSRTDLSRVDAALGSVFQDNYQLCINIHDVPLSPLRSTSRKNSTDERTRFSHPLRTNRHIVPAGFMTKSRRPLSSRSPSTTSTTSLGKLHEKLENFAYLKYNNESVGVSLKPQLSVVNELTEEISNSLESTDCSKFRRPAVNYFPDTKGRKAQSDGEAAITPQPPRTVALRQEFLKRIKGSQSDDETIKSKLYHGEFINSALRELSISSAEQTIIDATLEPHPKEKEIDVDHLQQKLQDVLHAKEDTDKLKDSGKNTGEDKTTQKKQSDDSETIEDTQYTGFKTILNKTKKNTVVRKSTSNESNTEVVNEIPDRFITVRKKHQKRKTLTKDETEKSTEKKPENAKFDVQAVEDFFSQHFTENRAGDLVISPTLAKKINETSSECSEDYLMNLDNEFNLNNDEIPDLEIVECLNNIVDQVCHDFDKCSEYLNKVHVDSEKAENLEMASNTKPINNESTTDEDQIQDGYEEIPLRDVVNKMATVKTTTPKKSRTTKPKQKSGIKLTFPNKKQKAKLKGKLLLEPVSKMSTIIEDNNESDTNKTITLDAKESKPETETNVQKTPIEGPKTKLARKKRKLYSPKDDQKMFDHSNENESSAKPNKMTYSKLSDDDDDVVLAEIKKDKQISPKLMATCYKDLEKDRQSHRLRTRMNRNKQSPPSPKTVKLNDMFEHLKDNIENHEVTMVDKKSDKAIFNFTSDSEDEEFKQKKAEVQKRTSTTTVGSCTSIMSTRRGRSKKKVDYSEDSKESKETIEKPKRKRVNKRNNSKTKSKKIKIDQNELIDERMREAPPAELNTSFVANNVDQTNDIDDKNTKEPAPIITEPELEMITDNVVVETESKSIEKNTNEEKDDSAKEQKDNVAVNVNADKDTNCNKKEEAHQKRKRFFKKQDNILPLEIIKDDDRTISPLPGLVIETEAPEHYHEESFTTNLIEKLQKICKDGPDAYNDTTVTQNMLSDNDKPDSPRMNITEELELIGNDEKKAKKSVLDDKNSGSDVINDTIQSDHTPMKSNSIVSNKKSRRYKLRLKERTDSSVTSNSIREVPIKKRASKNIHTNKEKNELQNNSQRSNKTTRSQIEDVFVDDTVCLETRRITRSRSAKSASRSQEIDITSTCEVKSEMSIATDGITAHADQDELPPTPKMLNERISPRELVDMNPSVKEYYVQLNRDVNTSKESNDSNLQKTILEYSQKRVIKFKSGSSSQSDKSKRFEYDLAKWLPSDRETESEISYRVGEKVKSPSVSVTRLTAQDLAKWLYPAKQRFIKSQMASKNSPMASINESKRGEIESTRPKTRKSQISPINFEDFLNKRNGNDTSRSKDDTFNSQSVENLTKNDSGSKRYNLRPTHESSPVSITQKTEGSTPRAPKKKSPLPKHISDKRRKVETEYETVEMPESRQSSHVDGWLNMLSTSYRADNFDASSDTLQNVMEKLDTTLAEIHQNTTKDFIGLFVDVQKKLEHLAEERRRSYRQTAVTILNEVTQLMDRHFAEMDQSASERDDELMSWVKERASSVLRRDCRQKKALVLLLREDVEAAAQRANRQPHQ